MDAIYFLFHGLCHQIPSRALTADGFAMPLCARCAGIHVGFFCVLPAYLYLSRRRGAPPTTAYIVLTFAAAAPFAVDGIGSFLAWWDAPAAARFASGTLLAVFLSPYIAALFRAAREDLPGGVPIATAPGALIPLAAAAILTLANVRPAGWLLIAESYAAAAGVVIFLGTAHSAVLTLLFGGRRFRLAVGLASVTVAAQLALFSYLRMLTGM